MKKYLVYGESIDKLFQEERIRRERGDIVFIPLPEDFEYKEESTEDVAPEVVDELPKTPLLDSSEDMEPNPDETPGADDANVETPEEPADDKTPDIEDIKDVDLDVEDTKDEPVEDTKEAIEIDTKEATSAKKTTKRSKKTE